jgi:hypothetical protein
MNEKELIDFVGRLSREPSDINEHLPTLLEYGRECETIVELGVRWPTSTWALLASKPKMMKSYDIKDPSHWGSSIQPVIDTAHNIGVNYEFIIASSLEIEISNIDLLFIDTVHCYNQLKQELSLHHKGVNKYIIMHDTTSYRIRDEGSIAEGCTGEGLWLAIEEFLQKNTNWTIKHEYTNNNGLTVLINENIL